MEQNKKSVVYFSKTINSNELIKLYKKLNFDLHGKIAIKLHSGEKGNQNYLKPIFWKPLIELIGGTVIEANTAYPGERDTSEKHLVLLKEHGWSKYFNIDLIDETGPDAKLPIKNGHFEYNLVGKNLLNYDSMIVLSHFKGHPKGGYGGALKQLSIGCASSSGKAQIHTGGFTTNKDICWDHMAEQDVFLESMAEAASTVVNLFKGNIVYINVMKNISVDCDCCSVAEDPCIRDIGVLISLDPVAIDQACIDLVNKQTNDPGLEHFLERLNSRNGIHTIEHAEKLGIGSRSYTLINITNEENPAEPQYFTKNSKHLTGEDIDMLNENNKENKNFATSICDNHEDGA